MRRLILAALFSAFGVPTAFAACPAVLTDCPSGNMNNLMVGGAGTFSGPQTYTGSGTAAGASTDPHWVWNYTGTDHTTEARPFVITATSNYSGAASSAVTLGLLTQLNTIVGTYPFGGTVYLPQSAVGGEHQSAIYGRGTVSSAPAMFGCTPGTNCPGTVAVTNGLNAFADNISTTEVFSARSIIIHGPTQAKSFTAKGYSAGNGGTIDMWSVLSSDDARSGIDVGQAVGFIVGANVPYLNNGFGTPSPVAEVHTRCGNRTDNATGWINGNTLYLATVPFAALQMGPGNVVTGPGMTSAHLMAATPTTPVAGVTSGGWIAYTIDGNAQTVGSQAAPIALTFTETCINFVAQNFSSGGLATIGFISNSGQANVFNATIDQGLDGVAPLGNYVDIQIGGVPSVYVYGPPGRPSGMAVGFTSPPPSVPVDNLWVSGSTKTDVLRVNTSGATSITTTGNVGIGTGHTGVANRLVVKGPDTSATSAFLVQDSNGANMLQVTDNGLVAVTLRTQTPNVVLTGAPLAAPAGQVSIGSTTTAATSCGSLASATGCLAINVGGATRYVPFY